MPYNNIFYIYIRDNMYVSNIVTYHYLYIYIKIPEQTIYTITNELIEKLLPYRFEYYFF